MPHDPAPVTAARARRGCHAQATLRGVEHNFAVCDKPADHTDAHEDYLQGVSWADEGHAYCARCHPFESIARRTESSDGE